MGNGGNGNRRSWGIVGAIIIVVIVISAFLIIRPSSTPAGAQTATPTATITPLPTAIATSTPTTPPVTTCPAAPTVASGTLSTIAAFFAIPGVPAGSVMIIPHQRGQRDQPHPIARPPHACSPGTSAQVTQAYASALGGWTACGAQCYQTTFSYNGVTLTKSVQVQSVQVSGGITNYQLALTLDAAITKSALPFAAQANIGFVSASHQDATWMGNGQLELASNTFAAPANACSTATATYAQLHQMSFSGQANPLSISQEPNQPTVGCLKTANGGLVDFSAYYTTDNQQLTLSYTVYVVGFV